MRSHLEIELGACVPILTPKYISSRFFENQPNEIYRHLSEKASNLITRVLTYLSR